MLDHESAQSALRSLHPSAIEDPQRIRDILRQVMRGRVPLRRGVNRQIMPELAYLRRVDELRLFLRVQDLKCKVDEALLLNFSIDDQRYAMSLRISKSGDKTVVAAYPAVIYCAERRDRRRRQWRNPSLMEHIRLSCGGKILGYGRIENLSEEGLAVEVPGDTSLHQRRGIEIEFLNGEQAGNVVRAEVCHVAPADRKGWKRIGLSRLRTADALIPVERRMRLDGSSFSAASVAWTMLGATARRLRDRAAPGVVFEPTDEDVGVDVVTYRNSRGERIRAIVNSWGDTKNAAAVVIPPAWGKTKETLLPLAATILASFRAAEIPIVVVRFDGTRRRGESFVQQDCRRNGAEYHRFTFSQAVDDIVSTFEFLQNAPQYAPRATVLVTFSASSIDGRKAVAIANPSRVQGWISVVGSADLQSMMRVVSGGIDFLDGIEKGLSFGLEKILGVEVDLDLAGRDALASRLAFLGDACRDFESIRVPVTWFHGRFDAWMDLERIRIGLSHGDISQRRLIEIPTGHQLRSSREALSVFQMIAIEIGRILDVPELQPRIPDFRALDLRAAAERKRLPRQGAVDKRDFWKSYLLGRDGMLGIELLTGTSAFQEFMRSQIDSLRLRESDVVGDLGSGTGSFPLELSARAPVTGLRVVELDFVRESLTRTRRRLLRFGESAINVHLVACDVDVRDRRRFPFRDGVFNAALASLLLGYLDEPFEFLKEVARVLKPGARFVASGLKKDADVSRIFRRGLAEFEDSRAQPYFDPEEIRDLPAASRGFLSEAARLLDLEEEGVFEFRDPEEWVAMLSEAGFESIQRATSFGYPPQAMILSATRRSTS